MRVICYSRRSDFLFKKTLFDFDKTYPRTPAALVETICHLRGIDFPCKSTLQFFRGNLPWKNTFSRMRMYFSKFNWFGARNENVKRKETWKKPIQNRLEHNAKRNNSNNCNTDADLALILWKHIFGELMRFSRRRLKLCYEPSATPAEICEPALQFFRENLPWGNALSWTGDFACDWFEDRTEKWLLRTTNKTLNQTIQLFPGLQCGLKKFEQTWTETCDCEKIFSTSPTPNQKLLERSRHCPRANDFSPARLHFVLRWTAAENAGNEFGPEWKPGAQSTPTFDITATQTTRRFWLPQTKSKKKRTWKQRYFG